MKNISTKREERNFLFEAGDSGRCPSGRDGFVYGQVRFGDQLKK